MEVELKADPRSEAGKGPARRLRAVGKIPAVLYGPEVETQQVSVDERQLWHALHTDAGANVLVDVRLDGDTFLAMPRQIQRDLLRDRFIHVDLLRVARDEKITVEVPV